MSTKIKRFFFKPFYKKFDALEAELKSLSEKYDRLFLRRIIDSIYFENEFDADAEKQEIANFLKHNPITVFPYNFAGKYNADSIEVNFDANCGMSYVLHENKRMYFPKDWRKAHMLFLHGKNLCAPYLRKGVIRASKNIPAKTKMDMQ
jgi:hypothetical protein